MNSPAATSNQTGWLTALPRLWLLQPLRAAPPRDPLRAACVLAVLWLAAWVAIDRWQSQPEPQFYPSGIPLLAWYVLAILALAALLRRRLRAPESFGTGLVLSLGAVPLPLLFTSFAGYMNSPWLVGAALLVAVYLLLYFARALYAVSGERQRSVACGAVVFIAAFVWLTDSLDAIPDVWAPLESSASASDSAPAESEALLFGQAARIDRALAGLVRDNSNKPHGFFLGFAGVGDEKVFAQEIGLASRVLGERYDMTGRSLSLINDERNLDDTPLATVSGLRYALRGLGARMNVDRDVLFLAISSHGTADPAIAVSNSDLPLQDLGDEDLADALRDSGIKWRVIIISACYAGGFIKSLQDPKTIVITAAAADRTSFGCSNDRDLTYFGEAFYRDALPAARTLRDAFETAKQSIAARERDEHITPSNPQAFFGAQLQAKLAGSGGLGP